MVRVFAGERHFLARIFGPTERWIYKFSGIRPDEEMSWKSYAVAMLLFNIVGGILLLLIELTQRWLPLNPQHLPNVPFALALNTAVSFTTNTNWQAYSGENTMSYFTQMTGLAVHNFVSAATGIAIAVALARGLVRKQAQSIGNFWADIMRCTLYLLLPLAILIAVVTSLLAPDWMARSAVIESLTPPAHDSMSVVRSWTIPRRSAARCAADGRCGMAASVSPATSTTPAASIHLGVRSTGHPEGREAILAPRRHVPPGSRIPMVPPGIPAAGSSDVTPTVTSSQA